MGRTVSNRYHDVVKPASRRAPSAAKRFDRIALISLNAVDTVFVQIASYRDPELIPTLCDLIAKSSAPGHLHVCVCWQHGDEQSVDDFVRAGFVLKSSRQVEGRKLVRLVKDGASILLLDVHFFSTKGACWARSEIQQFYKKEKYTLQLDSHHRFVQGWDRLCIDMLEGLREKSAKPLLTAYLPAFDPKNDPDGRVMTPWKVDFRKFKAQGVLLFQPSVIAEWEQLSEPVRARFYSAHFAFADGSFATEVQHDPEYFFHGEEISLTVRAFTHGYDLYHPHVLVAWHEYTREGRTKVWDDHVSDNKKSGVIELDWSERDAKAHHRNLVLFQMDGHRIDEIDFGKFGLGRERSLRDYEEYAGISFQYRGVQQPTLEKKYPPVQTPYASEDEWRTTFLASHEVRIIFEKSELPPDVHDYDFWYVGCHDEKGKEISRRDAKPEEIERYLRSKSGWIDFPHDFVSAAVPRTFTVWPHSKTREWLGKIVKNIRAT